jgi:glutaminyl-tRNA synthetase
MIETGFEEIRVRAPWPSAEGEKKQKDSGLEERPETVRFQGMRVAYFCAAKQSVEGKLVLNRICSMVFINTRNS